MPVVLGVDSSTQSTKVEVRDADDGTLVATGSAPHPSTSPPRSEQDPDAWFAALRDAVAASGVTTVDAVSVAAQQHGLVTIDKAGRVVRPAKLWNDTESAPQADELRRRLPSAEWAQRTGSVPVASFTITKLLWLAEREPEHFGSAAHFLLPHDWLTYRLTGRVVTDRGDASGTGYFSPTTDRWCTDLLELVDKWLAPDDWLDRLPTVLGPQDTAGDAKGDAVASLGLAGRCVVGPGTGDNMAAALGTALRPGDVVFSLGTSGTVYAVSDSPVADERGLVAGFADATGRWLPLVCVLNATQVTDAVAGWLGADRHRFEALALSAPPGAGGTVLVPHLSGERTPDRPTATGTMHGLDLDTSPATLARAAFEGVICGLLDGLDALRAAGVDVDRGRVLLVGGGSRSRVFPRLLADLLQRPITVADGDEHVATGACVQAAATLHGKRPDEVATAWSLGAGTVVEPDPAVDPEPIRRAYDHARG